MWEEGGPGGEVGIRKKPPPFGGSLFLNFTTKQGISLRSWWILQQLLDIQPT